MNTDIDQVVTEYLVLADKEVQCKAEAGYGTINTSILIKSVLYLLPTQLCEMQFLSVKDIWCVIELPWGMEGVGVKDYNHEEENTNNKDVFSAFCKFRFRLE